ncbi:MAG: geranylgeranyl reductase family protein [Candidatus Lokiarchaeota archaeon]|nr:geranylgeranyl reductase family protein [Candidatus Lokiarchaeota archaeon]
MNGKIEDPADISVIGAGPSGSISATEIKKMDENINVLLFEEHERIGEPMQCAGLISTSGFEKLKIKVPENCVLNTVKGARFYSPDGNSFKIKSKKEMARVIDRRIFDKFLVERAVENGVQLYLGSKVLDVQNSNRSKGLAKLAVKINHIHKNILSKIILDAEGVKRSILNKIGIKNHHNLVPAVQIEMANIKIEDSEMVELFFGRKVSPGFFAYIIPTSENSARIAAASSVGNPYHYLRYFLNKHPHVKNRIRNASIIEIMGGSILTSGPLKRTYGHNLMLIGDVAGHVKATTGGGVIMGGLCSKIAAEIAVESIHSGDYSKNFLKKYSEKWRRMYMKEFKTMNLIRLLINSIPNKIINALFKSIKDYNITKIIESYGDMDFQSEVIQKVIFSHNMPLMLVGALLNLIFGNFQ